MAFAFGTAERTAQLTLVCGIGEFGKQVVDVLHAHIRRLPESLRLATDMLNLDSGEFDPASVNGRVATARERLAGIDNTDRIELTDGWRVEREGDRLRVRHFAIGRAAELLSESWASSLRVREDSLECIALYDDLTSLETYPADLSTEWNRVWAISHENGRGELLDAEAVAASAAGFILLRIMGESTSADLPDAGPGSPPATFGVAGLYPIVGPAFERLTDLLARNLIRRQLADPPGGDVPHVQAFSDRYQPAALALRLFDPERGAQRTFEGGEINPQGIPAIPSWAGDELHVEMDRGGIALVLTPPESPTQWSREIRRYARLLEMTLGYQWRLQLESAATSIASELQESFLSDFVSMLDRVAHAPFFGSELLDHLEESARGDRRAMALDEGDLDRSLEVLDRAIAERPNATILSLHLALWLVPALWVGSQIVAALYEGARGVLFPVLFAVLGICAGVGWVAWTLMRADRRVQRAREDALEIVTTRQAAILSENAVGYLEEIVVPSLEGELRQARATLDAYTRSLEETEAFLTQRVANELKSPVTWAPVLSSPGEFDQTLDSVNLDLERFLREAIEAGCLQLEAGADHILATSLSFAAAGVTDQLQAGRLGFAELWALRDGTSRDMAREIERLGHRAAPLVPMGSAPGRPDEKTFWLVPQGIGTPVAESADSATTVVSTRNTFGYLCCLRIGLISNSRAVA